MRVGGVGEVREEIFLDMVQRCKGSGNHLGQGGEWTKCKVCLHCIVGFMVHWSKLLIMGLCKVRIVVTVAAKLHQFMHNIIVH